VLLNTLPAIDLEMPSRFRAAGKVSSARFSPSPTFRFRSRRLSVAQKNGKRYEAKALRMLNRELPHLLSSPWIEYTARAGFRFCQPDALFVDEVRNTVTIFEIKYSHTIDAFWQLSELYAPVVRTLYPGMDIRLVELTRTFDPATLFPLPIRLFFSLHEVLNTPVGKYVEVLQWK
jgi:hypothetical protein